MRKKDGNETHKKFSHTSLSEMNMGALRNAAAVHGGINKYIYVCDAGEKNRDVIFMMCVDKISLKYVLRHA
jgi:transketolase